MKGQQFTVMKMLVGAVFAMILLIIIYESAVRVDCPLNSFETIRDLVIQAARAPEKCFERTTVCFNQGEIITKSGLDNNLQGTTVTLSSSINNLCTLGTCTFTNKYKVPVNVLCIGSSCSIDVGDKCT